MKKNKEPKDKGRSEMGDEWREWKEEARYIKERNREVNTSFAQAYSSLYDIPIVTYNNGMQPSFQKNGLRLDYFPTSGKILIGKRWTNGDLEEKIKKHFDV